MSDHDDRYPERATAGDDLADQINLAYREIQRDAIRDRLHARDARIAGMREEDGVGVGVSRMGAAVVAGCFIGAALIVVYFMLRAVIA